MDTVDVICITVGHIKPLAKRRSGWAAQRAVPRRIAALCLPALVLAAITGPMAGVSAERGKSHANSPVPAWQLDLRPVGYSVASRTGEGMTDFSFAPACFCGSGELVVSFVARQAPAGLERRGGAASASPIRLRAVVLDVATGKQAAALSWGVEHAYGGAVCIAKGGFIVATLDRLRLYSASLSQVAELPIPPASNPGWVPWALYPSPDGSSLLLEYYEPRFSPSNALTARERSLVTTNSDYQWIDSGTLRVLRAWTEKPMQYTWISDTQIAATWTIPQTS